MSAKTGANTTIILKKGGTFGTAVEGGVGDKLIVNSLTHSRNSEQLTSAPIGAGLEMLDESDLGTTAPSVAIEVDDKYSGAAAVAEALFFQADSVTGEASSTYSHSFLYNATRTGAYGTIAFEPCTGSIIEYVSCTPTRVVTTVEPDNYVKKAVDFISNEQELASAVNTTATIAAATTGTTYKVIARSSDEFRITSSANFTANGGLNAGDVLAITGAEITFTNEAESPPEIRDAAGLGAPIYTGAPPFTCELQVNVRNNANLTWFSAAQAGTEYVADLTITSATMAGGSIPFKKVWYFPRLKLMQEPDWNLANSGDNPVTLRFTALTASAVKTGMSQSTAGVYPHVVIVNAASGSYLA